jgi:hypothetical protein
MNSKLLSFCAAVSLIAGIVSPGFAAEPQKKQSPKSPSIEGTYKLVSRKFSDGKVLSGQEVIGLLTYTKTHRNFNIAWKDSAGKHWSYSVVSSYTLTSSQYTETILVSIMNNEIGGKGTAYTMNGSPQSVPVKMVGGRIEFKMPFDPITAVFDGDKFIGTNEGVFVDRWEKVK